MQLEGRAQEQPKAITILLADDHAMFREGLAAVVQRVPDIQVIGECADGNEVLPAVLELRPEVLVLDIALPSRNGLDVCQQIKSHHPATAVLILTMHNDEQFRYRALDNGASGYLVKEAAAEQLCEAIRAVGLGGLFGFSRADMDRSKRQKSERYDKLTPREKEVLYLIACGKKTREVAESLHRSVKTVETHRMRLMKKLGVHDLHSLLSVARRVGVVPSD